MSSPASRIAIIPARGGSKRIPRKNVRPFAGRPMIAHAIGAAQASGLFDRIVVSTDDAEIAGVALAWGAEVPFTRPAALADDLTPTVPVIRHAIEALGLAEQDLACCIYACVPLLKPSDLVACHDQLAAAGGTGFAFPVAAFASPIQRALRRDPEGRAQPFDPSHVGTRTQDLEPAYFDAGQFYWADVRTWRSGASPHVGGLTFLLPAWRVVDIDTPEDWERAEALWRTTKLT